MSYSRETHKVGQKTAMGERCTQVFNVYNKTKRTCITKYRNTQRKYTHTPLHFKKKKTSKIKIDKVEGRGDPFLCHCQAALAMLKVMWSLQLPGLTLIRYV